MRHMRSRRILAMLLALSMIFGLLTTTALADNEVDQNPSNVGESAANGTSAGDSGEGQPSGASEDEASTETNKEDVLPEEETIPEEKKTTSDEEVDTQVGDGKTPVEETTYVAFIGEQGYASLDAAIQAAQDNDTIVVSAGEYTLSGSLTYTNKAFMIKAADGETVSFDMSAAVALHGAKITFEGVTFNYKTNGNYIGLQHADTLVYNNCVINGMVFLYATNETFNNCTFNQTSADAYNVWTYGAKNVAFNSCTFNCVGKSVLVYNEGANAKTDLNVNDTTFNASAPVEGKAAIEIDTSLMTEGATITVDANTTADGFATGSNSGSTLWNDKKQTADTNKNTTVTVANEAVFVPKSTGVATVDGVSYDTLEDAFAVLSNEAHTLTLNDESAWDATTPVYWAAGEQNGYAATLAAALTAAYKANAGDITIICRPGADVGEMTHGHVADNLTIYGNDAYISGGECELEVDTFKFDRNTGKQATDGVTLDKDITITAYELDNLGVWGQRNTGYTVNVNLTDCDTVQGITVQRVYISGTTGMNNITLTGCDFGTTATSVYSNADGDINITNCSFTGAQVPVNFNHKTDGEQTLRVLNCEFNACGDAGEWKQFAAPVRFVNSGSGKQSATVDTCTFTDTVGANGDILIGDGRMGQESNDVNLTVTNTAATVMAQKPGYYNGTETDKNKLGTVTSPASGTLTTSVKTLISGGESSDAIVDEKTLRKALFDAPTNGTQTTIKLESDITLEMLYAAENFDEEKLDDNAAGDTFNRYKLGVHPTEDDPDHWNPLVTGQSQEARLLYGAYYHMNATDERIARLVVKAGQDIVLDLNGHTIQKDPRATHGDWSNTCTDILANYGTLTITDTSTGAEGTIKGNGYISCQGAVLHNYAGATMNVGAINVDGNAAGMSQGTGQYVVANEGGTLSIDGANIFDTATSASLLVNTAGTMSVENAKLNHPATKTFNVKGGTVEINEGVEITSDKYAIYVVKDGTVKLNANVSIQSSSETATPGTLAIEGETARVEKVDGVVMDAPAGYKWDNNVLVKASIDLDKFLTWAATNGWNVDGSNYTDNTSAVQGGKLVVKWSPVSGCYDTREGHTCTVNNAKATGNTPKRVNNSLTQFQILEGSSDPVTVRNVKFVYEPADFTVCANSGWKGSFTAEQAPAGQLYFMTTGDVTFESCDFDKVVLTTFNTTGTSTVTNCNFANVYNNYAIKDIRGANVSVTGTTITNCGGGIMVSSTGTVSKVTLTGNTFTNVDVEGTAAADKVGTRAILQFADSGDYAKAALDFSSNTATNCGPVVRQLNKSAASGVKAKEEDLKTMQSEGQNLYTSDSKDAVPAGYVTDENGNVTISTAEGLFWFAKQANAGNNFAGKTVTLTENVDLGNELWTPIGVYNDSNTHFKGTFDGQNHTVSGLKVVEYKKNGVGFFGKVYTGTIKNLTVEGNVTAYGCNYVGGIVGHGYATITNCVFKGDVGGSGSAQVGGIAGSGGFTVSNCAFYGNVSANYWAGGIVANAQDGGAYTYCYVEGTINSDDTYWGGGAAGIMTMPLYPSQVISNCYSNTVVKVAGKEVNCPIIASYNNPLDYSGYTGDLKIYDNSWNKEKNSNDSYPIYAEKNGVGGVLIEGKNVSRDNNLIMFEAELQSVTDLNKVRIMPQSSVTQEQVDALAVAAVGESKYISLAAAIAAAEDGNTVTLLKDATEDVEITKNITLDLGGKTLTNTGAGKATITIANGATATVKNGSVAGGTSYYNIQNNGTATFEGLTATAGNDGSSMIDNYGTLTITSGEYTGGLDTIKNEPNAKLTVDGGTFTLTKGTSKGFTGVIFNYGELTINDGTFIQSDKSAPYGQAQVIHTDKSGSNAPSTVIKGGTFKNLCTAKTAWTVRESGSLGVTKISGGTFNKKVQETYCADGFIPTKNADGTYGVKEGKYVATVDSTGYETLAAAVKAKINGKTVTLLDDVAENIEIAKAKNFTLDLNGHTINGGTGTAVATIKNCGTVTITDSSAAKTGTIKRDDNGTVGEKSYYVIRNIGTMTIEQAIVTNNSGYRQTNPSGSMQGSSLICNGDDDLGGTLNISGGTFEQQNFLVIKNGALGTLNVTGGTFTSKHSAIQNWFKANITGGEIKGQLWTDSYKAGESDGKTVFGGNATFTGEIVMDIYGNVPPTLEITGGKLDVTNWRITTAASKAGAKPAVSGGTFTKEVPANYCAAGYIPVKNGENSYGVKEGTYVAEVNGKQYETLQEAINAASRKQTVKLIADTTENVTMATSDLTLDLNGHTLNGSTGERKPALTVTARVTVKDSSADMSGTIMREDTADNSGVSSHYVIDVQGAGWLTFESGNVINHSGNDDAKGASLVRVGDDSVAKYPGLNIKGGSFRQDNFIAIKVDRGDLFLNGGTITSANSYAIENWFRTTIKGGTVNGTVASWTYSDGANSTTTISGGTVNGNVASVTYDNSEGKTAKVTISGGTVTGTLGTYSYSSNGLVPLEDPA